MKRMRPAPQGRGLESVNVLTTLLFVDAKTNER
jgi:hypothetical protein